MNCASSRVRSACTTIQRVARSLGTTSTTTRGQRRPKVVVALSGGVDSSVALYLLKHHCNHNQQQKSCYERNAQQSSDTATKDGTRTQHHQHEVDLCALYMHNWIAEDETQSTLNNDNERQGDEYEPEMGYTKYESSKQRRDQRRQQSDKKIQESASASQFPSCSRKRANSTFCTTSERDARDAASVCHMLNVPFYKTSFAAEYWTEVFEPYVQALDSGEEKENENNNSSSSSSNADKTNNYQIMPNPDIYCNVQIKFGRMREYVMTNLGAHFIATGHYSRLCRRENDDWRTQVALSTIPNSDLSIDAVLQSCYEADDSKMNNVEWIEHWGRTKNNYTAVLSNQKDEALTPLLLSAADLSKDQSYFLSMVPGKALSNVIFPLGNIIKCHSLQTTLRQHERNQLNMQQQCHLFNVHDQGSALHMQSSSTQNMSVRDIASMANLPNAKKKESMGICFIGKRKFADFISNYISDSRPGNFVCVDTGIILGQHGGSKTITIGQGSGIDGVPCRFYVVNKVGSTVFVCAGNNHPALYTNELYVNVGEVNWIAMAIPPPLLQQRTMRALCRIRHLDPFVPCEIQWTNERLKIITDMPLRAVTPGQIAALYLANGLLCLGGAPIIARGLTYHERGLPLPSAGNSDLVEDASAA